MSVRKLGGTSYSNAYPQRRKRTRKKERKVEEEDATVEIGQSEERGSESEGFSTYDQHGRRGNRKSA